MVEDARREEKSWDAPRELGREQSHREGIPHSTEAPENREACESTVAVTCGSGYFLQQYTVLQPFSEAALHGAGPGKWDLRC